MPGRAALPPGLSQGRVVMPVLMACQRRMLRRRGCAVMLASITALLASCAAQATPDSAATAPAQAGQLHIRQVTVGNALPAEGALSYIRVERATGATVSERQLPGSHKLTLQLAPGAYRLVSWQRVCDGNCGSLDPPSQRCARPFTLRKGGQLAATIRVNFAAGCAIVLHP